MEINKIDLDTFDIFDKSWALLTAGNIDSHNSMTISWGEIGTLWSKPVATVYVKPIRYTYNFMENNEYFVVSFFDKKYQKSLSKMGSLSGRDINKDEASNLTPKKYKEVVVYEEASIIIICKKIYYSDLDISKIPAFAKNKYYLKELPHRMYIGEIIDIVDQRK